ncbi:uncharacterized protein LOC141666293 [Apium graveolens]|uniref:uncharacterized protein LOC141666293 n=1 Tax=Apium graveolens TaxID=4045 RepID=UPI003D7A86CF
MRGGIHGSDSGCLSRNLVEKPVRTDYGWKASVEPVLVPSFGIRAHISLYAKVHAKTKHDGDREKKMVQAVKAPPLISQGTLNFRAPPYFSQVPPHLFTTSHPSLNLTGKLTSALCNLIGFFISSNWRLRFQVCIDKICWMRTSLSCLTVQLILIINFNTLHYTGNPLCISISEPTRSLVEFIYTKVDKV